MKKRHNTCMLPLSITGGIRRQSYFFKNVEISLNSHVSTIFGLGCQIHVAYLQNVETLLHVYRHACFYIFGLGLETGNSLQIFL